VRRALSSVAAILACVACTDGDRMPTAAIERTEFVREVTADGYLQAKVTTPVPVPQEADAPMRVEWLIADGSRVSAGELVARFDETGFRNDLAKARGDRSSSDLRLDSQRSGAEAEAAGSELDARVARHERELAETFQRSDETLFSRHERIESELDKDLARSRENHALAAQDVRGRVAHGAEALLVIDQRQADLALTRAQSGLAALSVTAPHEGLVVFMRDWRGNPIRPGDTVWPGQRLAEIPELSVMQAEVFVLEADAGGLAPGASGEVRLEAHPDRTFGATVERVDKVAKPRWRNSPVQYFGATLSLSDSDPAVMRPGQRVRAHLTLERRPEALVVPRAALFEREGESVVFVERGDRFAPVVVEILGAGAGRIALAGDLREGQRVALADPEAAVASPGTAGLEAPGGAR